jgi:charged multivesicular body protein 4
MSGWGFNLFGGGGGGGSTAAKKNAPKEAILKLRSTLEMLSKREKHLQNLMDEQDALARKNISTNKTGEWNNFMEKCGEMRRWGGACASGSLCAGGRE